MTAARIIREGDGATIAEAVELLWHFLGRLRGLMFRAPLAPGEGAWLKPCSSIHMMFMRFSIDVLFLDAEDKIVKIVEGVRPWIGFAACRGALSTLELAAGEAAKRGVSVGDKIAVGRA